MNPRTALLAAAPLVALVVLLYVLNIVAAGLDVSALGALR